MLTDESKVFIRSGLSARDPRGVEWCDLDMTQLGKAKPLNLIMDPCTKLLVDVYAPSMKSLLRKSVLRTSIGPFVCLSPTKSFNPGM